MVSVSEQGKVKQMHKNKVIDIAFFVLLLFVVAAVMLTLFYRQTIGNPNNYHSDMKAYILEMQGLDSGYSFPYPVFFKLAAFIHLFAAPELSVAIATMLLNVLSMVLLKIFFNRLALKELSESFPKCAWLSGIVLSLLSASLLFISMLYLPNETYLPGIKFKYLGVFTANPFHNATYMAARPFAILAFFWYAKLLTCYEEGYMGKNSQGKGVMLRDYVLFAIFLLLATMTKPSFTIVLVGAAGLIMVYRMFKSRFRNFVPTLLLGVCFIPTFVDLLYQFKGVFVPEEGAEGGMGFGIGTVWSLYCNNMPAAICLAVGFPLVVLLLNFKELKNNTIYRFSWQLYLMSLAMAYLLYEKGFRQPDFNFSWGYMYGIFFSFVGSLLVLLKATAAKKRPLLLGVQWLVYLGHLGCGLYYFLGIFRGGHYY